MVAFCLLSLQALLHLCHLCLPSHHTELKQLKQQQHTPPSLLTDMPSSLLPEHERIDTNESAKTTFLHTLLDGGVGTDIVCCTSKEEDIVGGQGGRQGIPCL